ncbi:MAG TPA: ATP-binding cassette domain-containing protein [Dissulfurispiraceae bacterium]|nr:ATP-binding cassette domain-containing protein [Dissulfurispiraceae bacterium]
MSLAVLLDGVARTYGGETVLGPFTHAFEAGTTTVIMGPNGSGKSTLLRLCALLEAPDAGSIRYYDRDAEVPQDLLLRRRVTLVFPKTTVFRGTVFSNVAYGPRIRGNSPDDLSGQVEEALISVGLVHKIRQDARTLSSGEAQRLGIARALALRPELLLLDEPTASVDEEHTTFLEELIVGLGRQVRTTVIMTTHDRHQAEKLDGRILFMKRGVIFPSS